MKTAFRNITEYDTFFTNNYPQEGLDLIEVQNRGDHATILKWKNIYRPSIEYLLGYFRSGGEIDHSKGKVTSGGMEISFKRIDGVEVNGWPVTKAKMKSLAKANENFDINQLHERLR